MKTSGKKMVQPSEEEERNYDISSESLTEETTNTKKQRLFTSTGTVTSPSSLDDVPLPTLTFDLIAEILCRLPVKLLLQLRCLGKSWKSLISDPKFAKKHLRLSIKRHHLIVSSTITNKGEFVFYDSPMSSLFSTLTVTQTQLNYPVSIKNRKDRPFAVCSCDGILCITNYNLDAMLWNPSIKQFKMLPSLTTSPKRSNFSVYSFGYDNFTDNYKIIVVSPCIKHNEVSVLTLGTDYWRRIDDFPFSTFIRGPGVFLSGTVNWVALDPSNSVSVIVSLDLEKELYQNIWTPDFKKDRWTLGVLKDSLCIFSSHDVYLDVWIMKEYGNKESWTKLYNVPYIADWDLYYFIGAFYISEDDQMLMGFYDLRSNELELVVYDSKNGTLNIPKIQSINHLVNPEVYIESLISPCY